MRRALTSFWLIGPCLFIAGLAQFAVCHVHSAYTDMTSWMLITGWAIGSLTLAWFERRLFFVYFGSVALAAPGISYSMIGYGALEMGGWFHALSAGVWVLPFYFLFRRIRARTERSEPARPRPEGALPK